MIRRQVNIILEWLLFALLLVMTIDVLWGVGTRYLLNNQSTWTDELARYLMIWVSILGAAYVSGKDLHISIDLLSGHISKKSSKRLYLLLKITVLLFVATVFLIGGLRFVYIAFKLGQVSPALHIPLGVVYSVLPISGLCIIYFKLGDLFTSLQSGR